MTKKNLMPTVVLTSICLVVALLLSAVNFFTSEQIRKNNDAKLTAGLVEVLAGADTFEPIDLEQSTNYPSTVTKGYKANNGGCVFEMTTVGYKSGLVILVGVDSEGKVSGAKCLSSSETLSHEKTYGSSFLGSTISTVFDVALISGATKTTEAYRNAVRDALNAFAIANGGAADDRTPEEILSDNLNEALGTEGKTFSKWFTSAVNIGGADAVYYNSDGVVIAVDDVYVAYVDGTVVTDGVDADILSKADAAYTVYSTSSKLDISGISGINSTVVKEIYELADGSLAMNLEVQGYGIKGDKYTKSGKPSYVEIVISGGTIVKVVTVEQNETPMGELPAGTVIGDSSYYGQYDGKDITNLDSVDLVSGATISTDAYRKAIQAALNAYGLVKGE